LVAIGLILIFSGAKKQPWEHNNWQKTTTDKKEEEPNDNPTTI